MKRISAAAGHLGVRQIVCLRCKALLEPTPSGFLTCPSGDRGLITAQVIEDAIREDDRSGKCVKGRAARTLKV